MDPIWSIVKVVAQKGCNDRWDIIIRCIGKLESCDRGLLQVKYAMK